MTHLEESELVAALRATNPDPAALVAVANHLRMAAQKLEWADTRLKVIEEIAYCLLTATKLAADAE